MSDSGPASHLTPEDAPEVSTPSLRRKLFLPQLERLLGDPADMPLDDSSDSVRVRLEEAVASVERRAEEATLETLAQIRWYRLVVGLSALIGAGAILVGLTLPGALPGALFVAGGEAVLVILLSRVVRRLAADCSEISRLGPRYRRALESCANLAELRSFARRIGHEMAEISEDPR